MCGRPCIRLSVSQEEARCLPLLFATRGQGKGAASLAGQNRFAPKCTEQHPSFSPLLVSLALTSLLRCRKESCPALLGAEAPFCVGLHRAGETPSALRALWQRLLIPMRSWVYSVGGRLLFSVVAVVSDSFRGRGRVDSCSNHLLDPALHMCMCEVLRPRFKEQQTRARIHHLEYLGDCFF